MREVCASDRFAGFDRRNALKTGAETARPALLESQAGDFDAARTRWFFSCKKFWKKIAAEPISRFGGIAIPD